MKKTEKSWYLAISLLFVIPMLILFVVSLTDTDATVSADEKRDLASFPELSFESLLMGKFSSEFETYFADTFPFRENLLSSAKTINRFYYISFSGSGGAVVIPGGPDDNIGQGETLPSDAVEDTTATTPPKVTDTSDTAPGSTDSGSTEATTEGTTAATTPPATVMTPTSWLPVSAVSVAIGGQAEYDGSSNSGLIIYNSAIMERYYLSSSGLTRYAETLNRLKELLPEVNVFAMAVPKAIEFKAPASYSSGSCSGLKAMNIAYSALKDVIPVDVWSALDAHRDDYTFFRTDHHWTQLGAYYGYRALASVAGFYPHELSEYQTGTYEKFLGSLYAYVKSIPQGAALADNPDTLTYYLPLTQASAMRYDNQAMSGGYALNIITTTIKESFSNKYLCYLGGDQPLIHITNPAVDSARKLVIIKESYGNALIPFLTDHFADIYVVDPRQFNGDGQNAFDLLAFARDNGVTDILCVNSINSAQVFGNGYYMNRFLKMLPEA